MKEEPVERSPEDAAFVRSLLEADPKDLPPIPRVAPMTVREVVDIPNRQARHALVTLEGERGPSWKVCVKRGLFAPGEKVLFVARGTLIRYDPRIKTAAKTPYRRKTIVYSGGVRKAYAEFKAMLRPYAANPGAMMSLAPFTEFHEVPTGTDVSALVGVTDDATLRKEEETRRAAKALRRAESEALKHDAQARRLARLAAKRDRERREEAAANGRMCFLGAMAPNYVKVTSLAHLEEHPEYFEYFRDVPFDVSEKEDGLNMTMYCNHLQDPRRPIHLCIGKQEVRWSENSYYWKMAYNLGIAQRLLECGRNLVLEGVVVGPHFRHGYEDGYRRDFFRVFEIFDLDEDRSMGAEERTQFCREQSVPVVRDVLTDCRLLAEHPSLDDIVALASQDTVRGVPRHGIVARSRALGVPLWFDVSNPGYEAFLRRGVRGG